uniref:Uncharacterized protein n=1 Tax=Brassica campestris TaxID=3711 RepID=M4DSJ4_BRACM
MALSTRSKAVSSEDEMYGCGRGGAIFGLLWRRGEEETDKKTATAEMENSRQFEIHDEKTWASLSRGREEMRYREEDERLALKKETIEMRERS